MKADTERVERIYKLQAIAHNISIEPCPLGDYLHNIYVICLGGRKLLSWRSGGKLLSCATMGSFLVMDIEAYKR